MEDLKLRLKYEDINIRSRCIQKLLDSVIKKAKGNAINASSVQIAELNVLLEACQDDSPTTCSLAVQSVVKLATVRCLNIQYAIDQLLCCMKDSSYQSVITGVCQLLLIGFQSGSETRFPRYSLLVPKHPLISAIEEKDDSFPFVLDGIKETLQADYEKGYQAMEPVILFVLCNPNRKLKFDYSKILFLESCLSWSEGKFKSTRHISQYIPLMHVDSVYKTTEVLYCLNYLIKSFPLNGETEDCIEFSESMLLALVSLAERSIYFGSSALLIIKLLLQLCPLLPKINEKTSTSIDIVFILLADILKSTSGPMLKKIVSLGLEVLNFVNVSSTAAAILALSVINVLPEASLVDCNDGLKSLLSKLLTKLETIFFKNKKIIDGCDDTNTNDFSTDSPKFIMKYNYFNLYEAFTSAILTATNCSRFAKLLDNSDKHFKIAWLKSVKQFMGCSAQDNFVTMYSLTAAMFLVCPDDELFLNTCLETLESVLAQSPHLATRLFPVLLYKLSLVDCPRSKLLIINFLPKAAVHKYSVPPVLGILQMMSKEPELKPQAIYLMLQLWKKQERCFSHLHSLLTETQTGTISNSGVNEVLVSQAAAILEVCRAEPEKHGHDFLNTLNVLLNKCEDESSLPIACLAIDGIITLCKAEMLDIRSTWKALSPRLRKDKRTLVLCRMYQLLSLIPKMQVKSPEYDKFMKETVENIWKHISAGASNSVVTSEIFKTLGMFPMDCHDLKLLPSAAKANLKLPASMKATPFEMSKLPEDVLTYIPGYCFIDLLTSFDDSVILQGFSSFLHSLVRMEVEELPRSVYSQTRHTQKKEKRLSEALGKVPEFLCNQFQARKSPALQKNLAVGVLFSYEPPIDFGKDGFPLKRSIAQQSRTFEQVLTVLLNEASVDTSDWHRSILMSSAWSSFMERAFFACEEARRAETELQCSHGHLDLSTDQLGSRNKTAWLWVRDRLVGIIKSNVKNTPTSHANAVYAISGLVSALDKFYSSLDESSRTAADESEEYYLHRNFTAEYVDTIICAMFPDYKPPGKVQSWLLTHLSRPNSSATYLVRGCAASALCHMTSSLMIHSSNAIPSIIRVMLDNLSHSSPVLSFYCGKGLGLFFKSLYEVGYADSGESQVAFLLDTASEIMKIYNESESSLTCCLIALTFFVSSFSQSADEKIKDWISTTCNIFYEKLMDEEKSSMQFEMICTCVTAMIISAVEGSCMPIQNLEDLSSWLEMNRLENPQCSGISISLGMQIDAYERFGHAEAAEMKKKISKMWFNSFSNEKKQTLQRIAALNGLCSLFSCGRGLVQVKTQPTSDSISMLNDLIPLMFQILSATRDAGLQNICSWEVGRLFAVNSNNQQAESSVSSTYSYLGEKSVLKPLMNLIVNYQKEEEPAIKMCHILTCLRSLSEPFTRPLPPINWTTILTPFLQQNNDSETIEAALKIALHQSQGSSYATNLMSSYCIPPLIHILPESCFKILLHHLPSLFLVLPVPKMQIFLQTIILQTIKKDCVSETMGNTTLEGILASLKHTGSKEQSKKLMQDAFISIFKYLKQNQKYLKKYLPVITEILLLLPTNKMDSLLSVSENADEVSLITMIWCYFVKIGKKSLKSLRNCIEEAKNSSVVQKEQICFYIYDCFLTGTKNTESEISDTRKCMAWLLETIGWIKVLEDSKSKYQLLSTSEVHTFLTDVCVASIIGCSGLENSYHLITLESLNHKTLLESLPISISRMCQKSEWDEIIDKIIDWLMLMLKSQYVKEEEKYHIKLSLCALRSTRQFQKKEIWTEVMCNLTSSQ